MPRPNNQQQTFALLSKVLSPDEIQVIRLLRERQHQDILVKVKDGVIIYMERTEKFVRNKKSGGYFG